MPGRPRLVSTVYEMGEPPSMTQEEQAQRSFALRKSMWRALGLVVIDPADTDVDDWLRLAVMAYARKRFGGLR